jgi:hypothetical protein
MHRNLLLQAQRKYKEVAEEKNKLSADNQELQQKYSQKAAYAPGCEQLFVTLLQETAAHHLYVMYIAYIAFQSRQTRKLQEMFHKVQQENEVLRSQRSRGGQLQNFLAGSPNQLQSKSGGNGGHVVRMMILVGRRAAG